MSAFFGDMEYYPGIGKIKFEGKESRKPFAFKLHDENYGINGKTVKEHVQFAIAFTFCGGENILAFIDVAKNQLKAS